jgi:hypothetical protein
MNINTKLALQEHLPDVLAFAEQHTGFLREDHVKQMAECDATRLCMVLVRCGNGRFACPAQDAQHFVDIITKEGSDYVRDLSLPVN